MKKCLCFIGILTVFTFKLKAQSFQLDFLFNSGITVGTEYLSPSAINDSVNFSMAKHQAQFVLPLKTKFGVKGLKFKNFSLKKLDAKASQIFLDAKFGVTQPSFYPNNSFNDIYNGGIGITAITASIKKGIWIYSANLYFAENSTSFTKNPTPNFKGYITKVKVKGLKLIYFYGASLIVNQGKIYPVPLFGFRKKLLSNFRASLVFPVQAKINYKPSKKLNFDLGVNFNGINTIYREGSALKGNDNSTNYRQLKTYVGINGKIGSHINIVTEIGYSSHQRMTGINSNFSQSVNASPYVSISLNYHFGKSVFDNFINRLE